MRKGFLHRVPKKDPAGGHPAPAARGAARKRLVKKAVQPITKGIYKFISIEKQKKELFDRLLYRRINNPCFLFSSQQTERVGVGGDAGHYGKAEFEFRFVKAVFF